MYEISPSTLKHFTNGKFSCPRCAWLKIKSDVRPPQADGLGAFLTRTHQHFFRYLQTPGQWVLNFPAGELVETELHVKSTPINGIVLHGYVDGLIKLENGGYAIIDLKTTQATDWIVRNYALQVNVYRYCLHHAADDYPSYPVERMALISFSDYRFGVTSPKVAGVVGELVWHEVNVSEGLVGQAVGEAAILLRQETPPAFSDECDWCTFYRRWGDPYERVKC